MSFDSGTSSMGSNWPGRRCLVTGAAGFIGSALCIRLRELGAEVFGSHRDAPRAGEVQLLQCDVSEATQVARVFREARPDCVFHLAGKVSGDRSLGLVPVALGANLVGTVNVLLAATEARCSNVVTLGSLHEPDQVLPPVPPTPYAAAKFAASAYARMFAEIYSLPVTIARPLMVYGAGQLDFNKLVPYVSHSLVRGEVAELSSGRQSFDWVYVDDVVEALTLIASRSDIAGHTIDIGLGQLTSVGDIALGIGRRLEASSLIRLGALPDRKLEPTRVADVTRTAALIGWHARVSVEEGLDRAVAWYRTHLGT